MPKQDQDPSPPPTILIAGRFEQRALLGRGAAGEVFRALDKEGGGEVAVKLIPLGDLGALSRFSRGVEALQALSHPQLPRVLAHGVEEGRAYLVTEVFEGGSLYDRIRGRRHLAPEEVHALLLSLLRLLDFLHGQNPPIYHRDIKPQNILFRTKEDWTPVLVDFDTVAAPVALRSGMTIVGTPGYTAPEQLIGEVSAASDLFSLGATFLFVATHIEPDELSRREGRFDLGDRLERLSPALREVLSTLVAPSLEERYQSAEEAQKALEDGPVKRAPAPPPQKEPSSKRPWLSPRARKQLALLAGGLALILILTLSLLLWSGQPMTIELHPVATVDLPTGPSAALVVSRLGEDEHPVALVGGPDHKIRAFYLEDGNLAQTWDLPAPVQAIFAYYETSTTQKGTSYRTWIYALTRDEKGLRLIAFQADKEEDLEKNRLDVEGEPLLVGSDSVYVVGAKGQSLDVYWAGYSRDWDEPRLHIPKVGAGPGVVALEDVDLEGKLLKGKALIVADGEGKLSQLLLDTEQLIYGEKEKLLEVKPLDAPSPHRYPVTALATAQLSSDGILASADQERILLWRIPWGEFQKELSGHNAAVRALSISRNGLLAAALEDGDLALWDTDSGALIERLKAHEGAALSVTLYDERRGADFLVSTGSDGKLRIWRYE